MNTQITEYKTFMNFIINEYEMYINNSDEEDFKFYKTGLEEWNQYTFAEYSLNCFKYKNANCS